MDLQSISVIKHLGTVAKPDGSTYATPFHKMYVSDTLWKAVAIVDVEKDEIVKRAKSNAKRECRNMSL